MAETQEALMHGVEELSEIIKAQTLKLTTRQRGYYMDAQSAQTGGGAGREAGGAPRSKRIYPYQRTPVELASA